MQGSKLNAMMTEANGLFMLLSRKAVEASFIPTQAIRVSIRSFHCLPKEFLIPLLPAADARMLRQLCKPMHDLRGCFRDAAKAWIDGFNQGRF